MNEADLGIIFLGFSEKFNYSADGRRELQKLDLIGLKNHLLMTFLPTRFKNVNLVFAVKPSLSLQNLSLELHDKDDDFVGSLNLNSNYYKSITELENDSASGIKSNFRIIENGWSIIAIKLDTSLMLIKKDGRHTFTILNEGNKIIVGQFDIIFAYKSKLTIEQIAAIESNPNLTKASQFIVSCKTCSDELRVYCAIKRDIVEEQKNKLTWYEELDDEFVCSCSNMKIDTTFMKKNMHAVLGEPKTTDKEFGHLYFETTSKSALEETFSSFVSLINEKPVEEKIQKFIEKNLVLLHQFPAIRIIFKPPIQNKFIADFGILTPQKELILVEIEKVDTRLLKKGAHIAAPLSHAIDQVTDWLYCINDHRIAILDDLNLNRDDVSKISGLVIAGVDKDYNEKDIHKLKSKNFGDVKFLTYSDIIASLRVLIERLPNES